MQQLITASQLATVLACSKQTVYQRAADNEIPHVKIGGLVRFDAEEIERWLESQRRGPAVSAARKAGGS